MMSDPDFSGQFLGVLGGMGPLAGATFMTRLTLLTPALNDQEHIPAILWSDPRVPERPAAYLKQGADPFPWMLNGIKYLERAGAKCIVIPCNTAHLWFERLSHHATVPILHIVTAVIERLRQQGVHSGPVGLLATAVTVEFQLYQSMLAADGYQCLVLEPSEIEQYCTVPIGLVKKNRLADAEQSLIPGVTALCERGAQAVILGCTELPLALTRSARGQWGIPIVDSIDALAHAAIQWFEKASATS